MAAKTKQRSKPDARRPKRSSGVRINGIRYVLDTRQKQLREVDNPQNFFDFDFDGVDDCGEENG